MPDVSVVIPMKNEAGNAAELIAGIVEHCSDVELEVIVIDDASTDGTAEIVLGMAANNPAIRLLQNTQSGGQSAAVHSGVLAANSPIVCTLDGDGQNPPSELPKLYRPLIADTAKQIGLVAGQRVDRQDTASKKIASKAANRLRSWLLNDGTRDTGCGHKGFRREVFLALPYFDHMHRYLPALARRDGWKIELVDVSHKERGAGTSNYSNFNRALVGVYDLIGVAWLIRRRKKTTPKEIT
jgi:dolichol-phosphate mannosyltransferase